MGVDLPQFTPILLLLVTKAYKVVIKHRIVSQSFEKLKIIFGLTI